MVSGTRQKLKRMKTRHRQAIQTNKTPVQNLKTKVLFIDLEIQLHTIKQLQVFKE